MANISVETAVKKFLRKRGWDTWYNENYWVHPKTVANASVQNITDYGMDLVSAFIHEVEDLPPFKSMGMAEVSKVLHETKNDVLEYYFGEKEESKPSRKRYVITIRTT